MLLAAISSVDGELGTWLGVKEVCACVQKTQGGREGQQKRENVCGMCQMLRFSVDNPIIRILMDISGKANGP